MKKHKFGADAQIERMNQRADAFEKAAREARKSAERVAANVERRRNESDETMSKNLRRFRSVKGMRDVRYRLSGQRRKGSVEERQMALKAFNYVLKQWKRYGAGFEGVPISTRELKNHLGVSERQVYRILHFLDDEQEVLTHLKSPGRITRYAITLPETEAYFERLEEVFGIRFEQIREAWEFEDVCESCAA